MQHNLRGNCILTALTATFLPTRPLTVKHQLLTLAKSILRDFNTDYSPAFMAEMSDRHTDSLQSLNYFLLETCSLPKVVFDPQRKFMNFLEENGSQEMADGVVENSEERTAVEPGKIYHTTG
jgi:hypothetical protein